MNSKKLILASQSPRRKDLLTQAGFAFEVRVADIDEENYPPDLEIDKIPVYLAEAKAKKIQSNCMGEDILILAADSLVFQKDKIFTKPLDRNNAIEIIQALSGATHTVITGVCLLGLNFIESKSVHTRVSFEKFTQDEIEYYVDNYQPFDKAGAYGIQDWLGLCKVSRIEGSYSNIMGLPMETIYQMLKNTYSPDPLIF